MDPGAAHLHREEGLEEEASAGVADVVGQAAARSASACSWRRTTSRSSPTAPTGSARAADATPRCWRSITTGTGRSGSSRATSPTVSDRLDHQVLLIDPGREDPRRPVPAPDRRAAPGRIPGGLALPRHAERLPARRDRVSPILSNIYLDRLDQFIEQTLLPAHNRGARRTPYRPYMRLWQRACQAGTATGREGGRALRKQMKTMPSRDPNDPGYRRLHYCRYADDWLLGLHRPPAGSRGDQGRDRRVPARAAQAGTVPEPRP